MTIADILILSASAVTIVVTAYLLLSYIRHRAITGTDSD